MHNRIVDAGGYGITLRHMADPLFVEENDIAGAGAGGILVTTGQGSSVAPSITGNAINGPRGVGIDLIAEAGGRVVNPSLFYNQINITGIAVRLSETGGGSLVGASQTIFSNSLIGGVAIANMTGHRVDARGNWFGTVRLDLVYQQKLQTFGDIDFSPFLATGRDVDAAGLGFQGDFSDLGVFNASGAGAAGLIKQAVDLVTPGGTVRVLAGVGAYREGFTTTKNVTIRFASVALLTPKNGKVGVAGSFTLTQTGLSFGPDNAGARAFAGNLSFQPGSAVTFRLDGPKPSQYDKIVADSVSLSKDNRPGPTLVLQLGYTPKVGQRFQIVSATTSGLFNNVRNLRTITAGGHRFLVAYNFLGYKGVFLVCIA